MTPDQVTVAARALDNLRRAKANFVRLEDHEVIGVNLFHGVTLGEDQKDDKAIGFPPDLRKALTAALRDWAAQRLQSARDAATEAGIELAAGDDL